MSEPLRLTAVDRANPLWRALADHYTERLALLRAQNDSRTKTEMETAYLRGQIAEVKAFLGLADERPVVPD